MRFEQNKRIAKNALSLYIRMIVNVFASLVAVRIFLKELGSADYGIFNVAGGVVMMVSFISGSMAAASQRFFSFELGRKDAVAFQKTFSMTLIIYFILAAAILLVSESAGLWFLNTKMTIPIDKLKSANLVYQFAIGSFLMTMCTIPYNAAIIAHEQMKVGSFEKRVGSLAFT